MDKRLILLRGIVLLYRESQLGQSSSGGNELVQQALDAIKGPKARMDSEFGKDVITYLRQMVVWMLESPVGTVFDQDDILDRIRVATNGHEYLFEVVEKGIKDATGEFDTDLVTAQCGRLKKEFADFIRQENVKKVLQDAQVRSAFSGDINDWGGFVREIRESLEPYEASAGSGNDHPSIVAGFSFDETEKMVDILSRGRDQAAPGGSMRYGWKGLNRMFGASGGSRRGEFIITPALQHNFKSGLNMMTMIHAAKYNSPKSIYPEKGETKPTLLRISFENDAELDTLTIYKFLYEAEYGTAINIEDTDVDNEEAVKYIQTRLAEQGWNLELYRIDPSDFGYWDLIDLLDKLQAQGKEIYGLWIDYPALMSKKGCVTGPAGVEYRDLIRRIRNYTSRHGITTWAPWQISTEGKMKIREGAEDFLKEIVGKGYYDSCRTIDQEVDMEIYIHIYKLKEDEKWLGLRRGKHRKFDITPEADLACYLPFKPIGTLIEDVNLPEDTSRRKLKNSALDMDDSVLWE